MEKNNKMHEEIAKRMNDDTWDLRMAKSVLARKKQQKVRYLYGFSLSSVAAAASLFVILTLGITTEQENLRYKTFISQQVHGTYNTVFTSTSSTSLEYSPEDDLVSIHNVDSMIDETLALR